jgi:hypothetical protein
MSSLIEAPEALQEEQYTPTDVPCTTSLPSTPRRGFARLLAFLCALRAPDATPRVKRVISSYQQPEAPLDILTRKYPDLYIRCVSL